MQMMLYPMKGKNMDITTSVTTVSLRGEYRSVCRDMDFGLIHAASDSKTWGIKIEVGDRVRFTHGGKEIFYGVVWSKSKETDEKEISFTCHDLAIYLKKNKGNYVFKNETPQDAVKKIAGDFGIPLGTVLSVGGTFSRIFMNVSLYDMIMTAYTLTEGKKCMVEFQGEKMSIMEKGQIECPPLTAGYNVLSSSVSETLESMVNRVRAYDKNDKLIREYKNDEDGKKYGWMTEVKKIYETDKDFEKEVKETLKGVERKITIQNLGDISYKTGRKVKVKEPYTGLVGLFYIDADQHDFKNGIYTNRLTLNFENLMDEKESGSDERK